MSEQYDAVIIGGGHNGLVCAFYLAKAGQKVLVLERRHIVGGAAVTEEFHPGFKNSTCSYIVTLLHPQVIADLQLERHGLRILKKNFEQVCPGEDGDILFLSSDEEANVREIERRSPGDGQSRRILQERLVRAASAIRPLLTKLPADHTGGISEIFRAGAVANEFRRLSGEDRDMLLKLFTMSTGDLLNEFYQGERIKGALGYSSAIGNFQGPFTPGTAFIMLYFAMGRVKPQWPAGVPVGGMGSITQAMARAVQESGVDIRVSSPVSELLVEHHKAAGVVLKDGTIIRSRFVVGNIAPTKLFNGMVDPSELPDDFRRRMASFRCASGVVRMNLALSELPRFKEAPRSRSDGFAGASVLMSPTLQYLEDAYTDAVRHGWSRKPVVQMDINSTIDDTLAPTRMHVANVMVQQCNPVLPEGKDWKDHGQEVADLAIKTIDDHAPNFKASIIGRQILTPTDLDQEFGLPNGDVYHGALSLHQIYSQRPAAGYAHYRSPIANLYMCGSGTHPGGGVTGIPGLNASRVIVGDLKSKRLARGIWN